MMNRGRQKIGIGAVALACATTTLWIYGFWNSFHLQIDFSILPGVHAVAGLVSGVSIDGYGLHLLKTESIEIPKESPEISNNSDPTTFTATVITVNEVNVASIPLWGIVVFLLLFAWLLLRASRESKPTPGEQTSN